MKTCQNFELRSGGGPLRLVAAVAAVLVASGTSEAGLTLTSSSASVTYSINTISSTGVAGSPQFTSGGVLLTPGGGIPILTGTDTSLPFQSAGANSLLNPFNVQSNTTNSTSFGNFGVPPIFGTAGTNIFTQATTSNQGGDTTQGGIFFDTKKTNLADALLPTSLGLAAVSFSSATATYTNLSGSNITVDPAALLSIKGTISGTTGSFVAAGLYTSFTLPGQTTPTMVTPIALAANQAGLSVQSTGTDPMSGSSIQLKNGLLFGSAESYYYNPETMSSDVVVPNGQSITITTMLTLITDPGSSIGVVSDLAPGFDSPITNFGAYAGGPFVSVPEPSAFVLLGLGLATVGAWRARAGRRAGA